MKNSNVRKAQYLYVLVALCGVLCAVSFWVGHVAALVCLFGASVSEWQRLWFWVSFCGARLMPSFCIWCCFFWHLGCWCLLSVWKKPEGICVLAFCYPAWRWFSGLSFIWTSTAGAMQTSGWMKRHSFVRGMLPYIGKECSGQGVFRAKRCLKTVSPCGVAGGDFFTAFCGCGESCRRLGEA